MGVWFLSLKWPQSPEKLVFAVITGVLVWLIAVLASDFGDRVHTIICD